MKDPNNKNLSRDILAGDLSTSTSLEGISSENRSPEDRSLEGSSSEGGEDNVLSGLHILSVDDDVDSLEITAFSLEQAGANVTSVASGAEALEAMKELVPDMLLSDVGMPEIDGYMLIRQIRQLPEDQGGSMLAIALTAYAGELDQVQALEAGFQRHLTKPVDPMVLVEVVRELRYGEKT